MHYQTRCASFQVFSHVWFFPLRSRSCFRFFASSSRFCRFCSSCCSVSCSCCSCFSLVGWCFLFVGCSLCGCSCFVLLVLVSLWSSSLWRCVVCPFCSLASRWCFGLVLWGFVPLFLFQYYLDGKYSYIS